MAVTLRHQSSVIILPNIRISIINVLRLCYRTRSSRWTLQNYHAPGLEGVVGGVDYISKLNFAYVASQREILDSYTLLLMCTNEAIV